MTNINDAKEAAAALRAVANWLTEDPFEAESKEPVVYETATELREVLEKRLPMGYTLRTYFRPGDRNTDPFWEAMIIRAEGSGFDHIMATVSAPEEADALAGLLRLADEAEQVSRFTGMGGAP